MRHRAVDTSLGRIYRDRGACPPAVAQPLIYGAPKRRPLSVTRFRLLPPRWSAGAEVAERPTVPISQIGALGGRRAAQSRRSHGWSRAAPRRSAEMDTSAGALQVWHRESRAVVLPLDVRLLVVHLDGGGGSQWESNRATDSGPVGRAPPPRQRPTQPSSVAHRPPPPNPVAYATPASRPFVLAASAAAGAAS